MKKIFYIIIAVISLFFIGTGKLLFEQQKDLLMQNSKEHIVDELVLLGGLAQLALMSKDYSQIEENLLNWVGHKEQIIFTEVALDSGFMIAQYGEKNQNPDYYTVTKAIPLFDGKNLIYTVDLSMESITNQLQSLFFTIVTWVVVSAIILISLLWLLIYRIAVVPLDKLMDGAQKIGQGHLDLAIEVKSQDEFGRLASEFNLMASKLKSLDITNKKALSTARRLADNLDNLPSPTLTVDREFHITFINKAGAAIAGLDPEECVGQFCYEVLNNSHCQTGDCRIAQAMAENRVTQAETVLDPKGRNIPIRYLGAPIHDEEGTVVGGLESFVDVSELQNALDNSSRQNRIREGEIKVNAGMQGQQQLTALCDNVLTVLCQWLDVQIGAIYLQDEKQFLRLTGGYAIRKDIEHASSFAMGEGIAGQAARQREIVIFNNIPANSIKLAGTAFEAAPLHSLAVPLLYEYNLKGVLELGSFTEFKQVDIEFIERIATNIAIAIDSAQVQEHINLLLDKTQQQTEELQAQQEELQASNEELREQTESLRTSESELQAQQEELRVTNEELTNQTNTLEKQQADIKFKNAELAQQRNELSRKAEALETTSRFKSEFLANMSHELRTPLNSILILSQLLSSSRQDMSDKQLEYAQTINSSGTELLELINEVLDLSKVEAGKMELIPEPLNLEEFLAELQQAQGPVAENRGISLQTELSRDVPETLVTDGQKLHQIIKNLLSNAIKFTETGNVTLRISRPASDTDLTDSGLQPQNTVALSVTDSGIGIAPDDQITVFQAFKQVDGTISRKYGGTGLGLSIVLQLVKLLDGEIQLHSEIGKGSTFTVFLPEKLHSADPVPLPQKKQSPVREDSSPMEQNSSLPQPNVADDRKDLQADDPVLLIIEDDEKFAGVLVDLAHERHFKCLVAGDGESGLHYADYYRPGAIILDIGLPGIDGCQVIDRLQKNPKTRHIPVHFISAADHSIEALQKGAIGYLTKPVSVEKLQNALTLIEEKMSGRMKNLLVVEDNDVQRNSIVELINDPNITIRAVATGEEAFQELARTKFDCLILDLGLQDISSSQLLNRIRGNKDLAGLPIIIYTGRDLSRSEEEELERYSKSIIIKGVRSPERLLAETTMFLHQVEEDLPEEKKQLLAAGQYRENVFTDKTILVVDDDMRNVFALSSVLDEKGMEVLVAQNGREGVDMLASHPAVDMVLMDIMMPEMDGFEAMALIRKQPRYKKLPIIALTAKAMKGDRHKCIEAGANDYLAKPVDNEKLLSLLRVWLY